MGGQDFDGGSFSIWPASLNTDIKVDDFFLVRNKVRHVASNNSRVNRALDLEYPEGSSFAHRSSESYLAETFEFVDSIEDYSNAITSYLTNRPTGDYYVSADHMAALAAMSIVPEANTYAMLLAGIGVVGVFARRKKRPPGY